MYKSFCVYMCVFVYLMGLLRFYGIATIVGYLRSNPVYSYILHIYI